uniref:Endonuclease/exonuclease/phosphatase domain-containing protein n=1 Tax=Cacopsylla melanoneura TaxID=428564 RepID=A0A8D8Q7F5_9HEMI
MRPNVKYSGLVPHSDIRGGTTLGKTSPSLSFSILQWNAGGLTTAKRTELEQLVKTHNADVFCIMEANLTLEGLNFAFTGYALHLLPKARQIASGILVGVRENLPCTFKIVKEMNDSDKIEIVKIDVWNKDEHLKIYCCYNPPTNSPDLSVIIIQSKTVIIGDFNAHSTNWGYQSQNEPGAKLEDFINTNTLELIYKPNDTPTFLHHSGSQTNPDLLMVSSDITENTTREVLEDPGSGHRVIKATITSKCKNDQSSAPRKPAWNFKKANFLKNCQIMLL